MDAALWQSITAAVEREQYLFSVHARRRLEERRIAHWQVVDGVRTAEVVEGRPDDEPNPSVVVREMLVDGTEIEAVWAWLAKSRSALLVTVYFR